MAETASQTVDLERRRVREVVQRRRLERRVALDDRNANRARLEVGALAGDTVRAALLERLDDVREALEVLDLVATLDDADTVLRKKVGRAVRVVAANEGSVSGPADVVRKT